MKLLAMHGLGDHRSGVWKRDWQDALRGTFAETHLPAPEIEFFEYDDLFEEVDLSFWDTTVALGKLAQSGLSVGWWGETREGRFGAARNEGWFDAVRDKIRWRAGYIVAWVQEETFRQRVRSRLLDQLADARPDVLVAHSLGSLIAYDALASQDAQEHDGVSAQLSDLALITLGSQIGNPFVRRNLLPGRIIPLEIKAWYHLYNSADDVFTAPIQLPGVGNFAQINSYFDIPGWADHDAIHYFRHEAVRQNAWVPLSLHFDRGRVDAEVVGAQGLPGQGSEESRVVHPSATTSRGPKRRALLVGINDYPIASDRLQGCVNDVYLVSAFLQEQGFQPESIRIVLNERATASGIRDRLAWLLDEAQPGDQLVFYFSGHGTTLPAYDYREEVDHLDEALVPFDFDWSPERAIIDHQIFDLYSQLHFDTRLTMIFDCCHSGGIHRSGSSSVRGLSPPDDIRHRAIRWDPQTHLWVPRDLQPLNAEFAPAREHRNTQAFAGQGGNVARLGRAMQLRGQSYRQYRRGVSPTGSEYHVPAGFTSPPAPYLPVIVQACEEDQLAIEYRAGALSYGLFTFHWIREMRSGRTSMFDSVAATQDHFDQQKYLQRPCLIGPESVVRSESF